MREGPRRATSRGRIIVWEGGSLWIGETAITTAVHAHHAIQVTLALAGGFRLRSADAPAFGPALPAMAVAADLPHAMTADGLLAQLFIEPESAEGRSFAARLGDPAGIVPLPPAMLGDAPDRLRAAWHDEADRTRIGELGRAIIAALAGAPSPRLSPDARVQRVIRLMRARPEAPPTLEEAAAAVRLSPGRLRHLFVAQTGLHYRGYLLWLRLGRAVALAAEGGSLTEAAHATGFADSAHLSRSFRRMFGLAPSSIRME